MAKRPAPRTLPELSPEVELTDGRVLTVRAVSDTLVTLARKAVRQRMADDLPLDPPTYEIETLGGAKQETAHTAESVEETNDPEVTAAWEKHIEAINLLQAEENLATQRVWLMEGIVIDLPEDRSWIDRQKHYGVDVPDDDPMELLWHYLTTEVLRSPEDLMRVLARINAISYEGVVSQEDADALVDSFRRQIQRKTANLFAKEEESLEPQD